MLHTHRLRASRQHLPELERELAALDEAGKAGKAIHLSARMVGLFVQLDREERGWKQQSLASLAGVSLSTIQRVERGEPTRESALVRIEQALGHDVGKYSAKRVPLPMSVCKKLLVEQKLESAQTVQIKIGLIKSTSQLAAMTRCNIITIDDRQVSDDIKKDIYEFRDLLESAALVVAADQAHILPSVVAEPIKRREIYSSLLARIIEIGNAHKLYVVGGTYSAEWYWSKIWHCLNVAPDVFDAAHTWVEHADWIPAVLTGTQRPAALRRGICASGHKAMYNREWGGYPDMEFLAALDPRLVRLRDALPEDVFTVADAAGGLTEEWADRLGLRPGLPVAVGAFDAHLGAVGPVVISGHDVGVDVAIARVAEAGDRVAIFLVQPLGELGEVHEHGGVGDAASSGREPDDAQ